MNLFVGIVGLPNVGKSTLFNAITHSQVEAANYPFATIKPNIGVVNVPDQRLYDLANLINPIKISPAICQFVDIAGLVKGASKGEGLGNQFLANIRETDAICHVVRCFNDQKIMHVYNDVDPLRDVEIVNLELILADLETVEKKLEKINRKVRANQIGAQEEHDMYLLIKKQLLDNKLIKDIKFTSDQKNIIFNDNFLTNKPVLYVANINEDNISNPEQNKYFQTLKKNLRDDEKIVAITASLEYEISILSKSDKIEFMKDLNIITSGLDNLILEAYNLLRLSTFFTFGKDEVKAWTFKRGMDAQQCAGLIHSDIAKGFIRAEIMNCKNLFRLKTEKLVQEAGLLKIEGKKYLIEDGDICYFRFNV